MPNATFPFLKQANFINGSWENAESASVQVCNPATGEVIGHVPDCGAAGAMRAIKAAKEAFPAWSKKTASDRAKILQKLAATVRAHAEDLSRLLTLEQGKPLAEARAEVLGGAAYVEWFAEEARRVYGDIIPSPWDNRRILVTKQPVGVACAITPWNFPSSMIARKIGAALAVGCTVVVKPSELTPFSGLAWGALAEEAGLPAGVINIITGMPAPIGDVFCEHSDVAKITFTGSTRVGKMLASRAAAHMKRFSMELGGHAPLIVFADADIERAVTGAVASKFRNAGQTCVCTNRIYVHESIVDEFSKRFAQATSGLKVGSGFDDGVAIGPLINTQAIEKTKKHIEDALGRGGKLLCGGSQKSGLFFEPTVISNASPDMLVAREETFGPVAPIFTFKTDQEAIALANSTEYGLACYLYTRDLARAISTAEQLRFGQVGINEAVITTEVAPFGGVKESGQGREGSKYGIEDYLDIKYICLGL